ncbi:biopolymer transporter ExbD [Halieaceae bacterium]|nr:biopolymer transporter ExbD [Halieaceae bacterium]
MNFKRQRPEEVSVNITPLIDVVFLLLIFFMVSTTFTRETYLSIDLPEANGQPSQEQVENIEIVINAAGQYAVNQRGLRDNKLETIKAALKEMSKGNKALPLTITADANTPHQSVVRAMDAAGQMGFVHLSITTRHPGTESS